MTRLQERRLADTILASAKTASVASSSDEAPSSRSTHTSSLPAWPLGAEESNEGVPAMLRYGSDRYSRQQYTGDTTSEAVTSVDEQSTGLDCGEEPDSRGVVIKASSDGSEPSVAPTASPPGFFDTSQIIPTSEEASLNESASVRDEESQPRSTISVGNQREFDCEVIIDKSTSTPIKRTSAKSPGKVTAQLREELSGASTRLTNKRRMSEGSSKSSKARQSENLETSHENALAGRPQRKASVAKIYVEKWNADGTEFTPAKKRRVRAEAERRTSRTPAPSNESEVPESILVSSDSEREKEDEDSQQDKRTVSPSEIASSPVKEVSCEGIVEGESGDEEEEPVKRSKRTGRLAKKAARRNERAVSSVRSHEDESAIRPIGRKRSRQEKMANLVEVGWTCDPREREDETEANDGSEDVEIRQEESVKEAAVLGDASLSLNAGRAKKSSTRKQEKEESQAGSSASTSDSCDHKSQSAADPAKRLWGKPLASILGSQARRLRFPGLAKAKIPSLLAVRNEPPARRADLPPQGKKKKQEEEEYDSDEARARENETPEQKMARLIRESLEEAD